MPEEKTPKGKPYSKDEVKKILEAGGSMLSVSKNNKKKNCWAVDLATLLSAGNSLRNAGKTEMRFFVTKDDKSPGDVIDPTTHLLFLETDSGCMEQFPPAEMP
jgi:hypothetical protein